MAIPGLIVSRLAAADIAPRRIVKLTADNSVSPAAAATDVLYGVSISPNTRTTGNRVDIVLNGTVDIELGGTVTAGARVTADANGKAVAASGTNRIIGIAEIAGVSGDFVPVSVSPG